MAPQETLTDAAQTIADSLDGAAVVPDSLAADTVGVDTTSVISQLNQDIGEAARALSRGEWSVFWDELYAGAAALLVRFVQNLIPAIFVLVLFYVLYRVLSSVLHQVLGRSKRVEPGLEKLLLKTYRVVALTFIAVLVLDQFGINIAALLAGLSIVGIAVGFAARDTLENFISGITILIDKPFRVGDNVEVSDTFGTIEEITFRSTRLRTLNNTIMVMPNIQMINQKLVNHTILGILRVEIPFGIAYKEYPQQARDVVLALTEGDDRLHPDYRPSVVVAGLNDSSVDMTLRLYLRNPKLEVPVRFEYVERVREALREADIEIPFPHLQLFVDEAKAFDGSFLLRPDLPVRRTDGGAAPPATPIA